MHDYLVLIDSLPPANLLAVAIVLSLSGVMSALSGFGFSAVGAACLFLLPPAICIPLLFALSIVSRLLALCWPCSDHSPLPRHLHRESLPFVLGGLAGVPFGIACLTLLPTPLLLLTFGALLTSYAVYSLCSHRRIRPNLPGNGLIPLAVGAAGGIIGGFTAFPGAVVVVWLGMHEVSKQRTRNIVQPYILCMQLVSLALMLLLRPQSFGAAFWALFVLMAPLVTVGSCAGIWIYKRISDLDFRRVVLVLLVTSGLGLLLKGITSF